MKKNYQKPLAELIEFILEDAVMNDGDMGGLPGIGGEGGGNMSGPFDWDDEE